MVYEPLPLSKGKVDFTERIKNVSIRYLTAKLPEDNNLDHWIVLPLYQHGHDLPIDNDGKTSLLLANKNELHTVMQRYKDRMDQGMEKINFKAPNAKKDGQISQRIEIESSIEKIKEDRKLLKYQLKHLKKELKRLGSKPEFEKKLEGRTQ